MIRKRFSAILISLFIICCSFTRVYGNYIENDSVQRIYVVKHGWHTGIIIKRSAVDSLLPALTQMFPEAHYLDISWGDKKYFMAPDDNIWLGIRAALFPTKSVIRVLPFSEHLKNHFSQDHIQAIQLTNKQLESMTQFFKNELVVTREGKLVQASQSRHFFMSSRKYWGLRTCNTWIAKALKRAGFPIKPIFSLTSGYVIKRVNEGKMQNLEKN